MAKESFPSAIVVLVPWLVCEVNNGHCPPMFGRPLSLRSPVGKRKIYGRHRNRRMFWWVYKEKVKPDFICDLKAVFLLYREKDLCGSTTLT